MKTIVIGYHRSSASTCRPALWVAGIVNEKDEGVALAEEATGRAMNVQRRLALFKHHIACGPNDASDEADVLEKAVEGLHAIDDRAIIPGHPHQAIDYLVVEGENRGFYLDGGAGEATVVDLKARTDVLREVYDSVPLPPEMRLKVEMALGMRPADDVTTVLPAE